jgi:vacuolar-type H+-ATPase subunit H
MKLNNLFSKDYWKQQQQEGQDLWARGDKRGAYMAWMPSPVDFGYTEGRALAADTQAYEGTQDTSPTEWEKNGTPYGQEPTPDSPTNRYAPSGGAGGAGTQIEPNNANIGDRVYDLNDPGQLQQYISDIDAKLNSDFDYFRQRAKDTSEEEIYEAEQEQQRALTQIERALTKLGESKTEYGQQYAQSVADLAEGFKQGTAKRQSFYASIAPRVYQSSQGTSQDYAEGKYQEGQKRYEEQKTNAFRDFGRAEQEYGENRELTKNQFNLYKTRRQRQYDDEVADKAQTVADMKGQARANTLNYSDALRQAGVSSNKFALQNNFQEKDLSQYKPSSVNLNDLMQFIKFQPAGAPMQASGMQSQAIATPEAGGASLAQHLGYEKPVEEQSTINAYKKGQGLY